ncbi:MAG: helix-turn-helix domain-containing protein, partial [Pyrinomonadaceae bacterium]
GTAGNHLYSFSSDIIRSEHFWNGHLAQGYESFTEMLFDEVTDVVQQFGIGTLIVDNITFLDRSSTANTDIALGIMRRLNDLKRSQFLSILVLAHAAKPTGRPGSLTEADMQGSVNLCNFADSVFALGRSVFSPELRYLKQIKSRSARIDFDAKNVPVFALGKFDLAAAMRITARDRSAIDNFLGYSFLKFADENKLSGKAQPESLIWHPEMKLKALKLVRRGKSAAKIASELGISRSTAYRYLGRRKS